MSPSERLAALLTAAASALMIPTLLALSPWPIAKSRILGVVPGLAALAWTAVLIVSVVAHAWGQVAFGAAMVPATVLFFDMARLNRTGRGGHVAAALARSQHHLARLLGGRAERAWTRYTLRAGSRTRPGGLTLDEIRVEYAASILSDAQLDPLLNELLEFSAGQAARWLTEPEIAGSANWMIPRVRLTAYANWVLNALADGQGTGKSYRGYSTGLVLVAGACRLADRMG